MNPDNFRWKQLLTEAPHTFRQLLVKIAKLSVTDTQHTIFLLLTEKIAKAHQVTPSNKTWSSNLMLQCHPQEKTFSIMKIIGEQHTQKTCRAFHWRYILGLYVQVHWILLVFSMPKNKSKNSLNSYEGMQHQPCTFNRMCTGYCH